VTEPDPPLPGNSRPVRSTAVAWQVIDGEAVLLRLHEKELLGLNQVGRRTWELADGTCSIDQMVATLTGEYRITAEAARRDIIRFVRDLVALGAMEMQGP